MKIVCLGDSITFGYGVPRSKCWVSLAQAQTGHTFVNAGVNGDTTAGMLSRLLPDALEKEPDILMLLGGTNDLSNGCPASVIQNNVVAILQQARNRNIRTMLGTLPPTYPALMPEIWQPTNLFRAPQTEYDAFAHWQKACAPGLDAALVDFYAALSPLAEASPRRIFPDGLHPGTEGHRVMAELFVRTLDSMENATAAR